MTIIINDPFGIGFIKSGYYNNYLMEFNDTITAIDGSHQLNNDETELVSFVSPGVDTIMDGSYVISTQLF